MTLADFHANGVWDCSHAFEASDFRETWIRLGRPTDREAAVNVVRETMARDWCESVDWIGSQYADEMAGLDPIACFEAWRAGWASKALTYVRHYMADWWLECGECGDSHGGTKCPPCSVCGMVSAGNTCCP